MTIIGESSAISHEGDVGGAGGSGRGADACCDDWASAKPWTKASWARQRASLSVSKHGSCRTWKVVGLHGGGSDVARRKSDVGRAGSESGAGRDGRRLIDRCRMGRMRPSVSEEGQQVEQAILTRPKALPEAATGLEPTDAGGGPVISLGPVVQVSELARGLPLLQPKPGEPSHRRCFLVGPRRPESLSLSSRSQGKGARRLPLLRAEDGGKGLTPLLSLELVEGRRARRGDEGCRSLRAVERRCCMC